MGRMSSQYDSVFPTDGYPECFGVPAPDVAIGRAVWPRQPGVFVRRVAPTEVPAADATDAPEAPAPVQMELVAGQFGLVPPWVKSASN